MLLPRVVAGEDGQSEKGFEKIETTLPRAKDECSPVKPNSRVMAALALLGNLYWIVFLG